ncbi:hypothetical protein [Novosphingobium beihaiensis]|uniref:Uncharacterized protein n=1 Tax=Novosphingobium beihaiensis TaxID=2930389 RepID=A0ABT0BQK8_9SPHN|nr:hypothetical protein [Novosphingobium beihaiensis]MCJ2187355.1 hypothetical protein [Novosphingobium beihaiensis]
MLAPAAGPPPDFDLGAAVQSAATIRAVDGERLNGLHQEDAPRPRKVKIRWRYQPVEGGPRFEVGTYGSRKGVMKSRLLHVAMDWTF